NFESRYAPLLIDALEEVLGNDAFKCLRKGRPDFILLLSWEHVDDTIHGFSGTRGMESSEHQVTRAGRYQGKFNGFQVTQLADQDDVRIFAQRTAQCRGK